MLYIATAGFALQTLQRSLVQSFAVLHGFLRDCVRSAKPQTFNLTAALQHSHYSHP